MHAHLFQPLCIHTHDPRPMSRALNVLWLGVFVGGTATWRLTAPDWTAHGCSPVRDATYVIAAAWLAFAVADWLSGACACNDIPPGGGPRAYTMRIARCCMYGVALALDVGASAVAWRAADTPAALLGTLVLQTGAVSAVVALDWASRYSMSEYNLLPTTGWRKTRIAAHTLASVMMTAAVGVFVPFVTPRYLVALCLVCSLARAVWMCGVGREAGLSRHACGPRSGATLVAAPMKRILGAAFAALAVPAIALSWDCARDCPPWVPVLGFVARTLGAGLSAWRVHPMGVVVADACVSHVLGMALSPLGVALFLPALLLAGAACIPPSACRGTRPKFVHLRDGSHTEPESGHAGVPGAEA